MRWHFMRGTSVQSRCVAVNTDDLVCTVPLTVQGDSHAVFFYAVDTGSCCRSVSFGRHCLLCPPSPKLPRVVFASTLAQHGRSLVFGSPP